MPTEQGFFYWRALAIQLGLIAYLVAGTFTDRVYAEAGYWLVGLSYALYRVQRTDQEERVQMVASTTVSASVPGTAPSPLVGARAR
jgi:hypothetical protein